MTGIALSPNVISVPSCEQRALVVASVKTAASHESGRVARLTLI